LTVDEQIQITAGGIPVPGGDSRSAENLTLSNRHMILNFASSQNPPWGMPLGGIIDASAVVDGRPGRDLISVFDFLPDNWSSRPNTYSSITVVESGPEKGIIRVERDWGSVNLSIIYSLYKDSHTLEIMTTITNNGAAALKDIYPGYTLYLKGGHMLSPPGLNGMKKGGIKKAMNKIFIGYDENRAIALHAPYSDYIDHFGQDMLTRTTLLPGESKTIPAWLQICPDNDISKILQFETERNNTPCGKISGRVIDYLGNPVNAYFIVVKKQEHLFTWCKGGKGEYSLILPEGDYSVYAVAENFSQSNSQTIAIGENDETIQNFSDLMPPGRVEFSISSLQDNRPLDARVTIVKGPMADIGFLGVSDYFTKLDQVGKVDIQLSPGDYVFQVSHAAGFTAPTRQVQMHLEFNEIKQVSVSIDQKILPRERNWYASDFHHHGDVLDGVTLPEYVLRSQLAAGLDFAFLSDHDSNEKNKEMAALASQRNCLFIPGMEISPAWGHFNIFPVNWDDKLTIEPGASTATEIFQEARRLGAKIIQTNHPYSTYGYFKSLDQNQVPGGFDPGFDLIELNYQYPPQRAMEKVWELWNQGCKYYLSAGTDTHSVWQDVSGSLRMYVYLEGEPSLAGCLLALKAGRSYASYGPLVFPEIIFGSRISVLAAEKLNLRFEVFAMDGIKAVNLICNGENVESKQPYESPSSCNIEFSVFPPENCWYALVILGRSGKSAYTNPIWIDVMDSHLSAHEADGIVNAFTTD
jgi:hypothetical protein